MDIIGPNSRMETVSLAPSPQGMKVVASSRKAESRKTSTDEFEVSAVGFFKRRHACGHRGARKFKLMTYGEETKWISQKERCPDCFLAYAKELIIRCALCGFPIVPGAPVVLYWHGSDPIRKDATRVDDHVMGCLRWDCCPSGGFFAGHWTGRGFAPAFPGGRTIAEQALATGEIQSYDA